MNTTTNTTPTPAANTPHPSLVERLALRAHSAALSADMPLTRRTAAWLLDTIARLRLQAQHARMRADLDHHVDECEYFSQLGDEARHARIWHERQAHLLRQRLATSAQALAPAAPFEPTTVELPARRPHTSSSALCDSSTAAGWAVAAAIVAAIVGVCLFALGACSLAMVVSY